MGPEEASKPEKAKAEAIGQETAEKAEAEQKQAEKIEILPTIEYEDFAKLDIRVGKVVLAEPIKKSKKLLRIEVDIGEEKPRQLVAGMASYYTPKSL